MAGAIAIIPARGGSKRIPFKNGKEFCGKPMIGWAIDTARQSGLFERVVVSTDDEQLADIARKTGAEIPFLRKPELADDHTGTTHVIRDTIARLNLDADTLVCCLYPTAVFARPEDLKQGVELVADGARWAFSVGEFPAPIQRAYRADGAQLVPFQPENMPKRSQDLEPAYYDAGQFYFARAATWSDPNNHVWDGAQPIVLPKDRCVDIDTPEDWEFAARLFQAGRG